MAHPRRAELEKLLLSLLGEVDVRRIVRLLPGGEDMHAELPGAGVSLTELIHQAVSVLERHGRLDGGFFEALVAERPARRDEIQALAARVPAPVTAASPEERLERVVLDADEVHGGRGYTRRRLGQPSPEAGAEPISEITVETGVILPFRSPARKNQQKPPVPTADPLAQALDDALSRKQRLEASGLSVTEVLDEIRKLKRELRRGGMLRPGDVLGHCYLLAEEIGQGGFGTVWRARDRDTNEDVAIKVLHPNLAGADERRQRFFRGARIMAELAHPAVVAVRQLGNEDDGFHYFVMDFLAGGNLHDAVLAQRVRREQIQPIILQVGAALAAAHKRGIVHRDVKPSNILLDDEGRPYLTDFDLVTAPDTTGGTRTGALGTFLYAPPEMLEHPQEATARTDVYGLGMTMAFMLHGGPLPRSSMHASRFVRQLAGEVPFRTVLARAVAREPLLRFSDAAEFCDALRNAMPSPAEDGSRHRPRPNTAALTSVPKQSDKEIKSLHRPRHLTLGDLVQRVRDGAAIDCPILVNPVEIELNRSHATETTTHDLAIGSMKRLANYLFARGADNDAILLKPKRPAQKSTLRITIGRSQSCDIRIPDSSVSSLHARILFDESTSEYALVDEGSRNGSFINGESIPPHEPHRLQAGAMLFFGKVAFYFITPSLLRGLAKLPHEANTVPTEGKPPAADREASAGMPSPDPDNETTADAPPSRLSIFIMVIFMLGMGLVVLHLTCKGLRATV